MISCTKGLQLVLGTACMHVKTIGILILGESENNGEKPRRSCPLYLAACMVSVEEKIKRVLIIQNAQQILRQ